MKLKRILSIICTLAMLATLVVAPVGVSAETTATISAGKATVEYGTATATVSVPINIEGTVTVAAMEVNVAFDSSVRLTKCTAGDALTPTGVIPAVAGTNPAVIQFLDITAAGVESKTGTFATLEFEVPANELKEFPLTVTVVSAEDGSSTNVAPFIATADGKITVAAETKATISADKVTVVQGTENATVSVPVKIDGAVTVAAMEVNVAFDSSVSLTKCTAGDALTSTGVIPAVAGTNPAVIQFLDITAAGVESKTGTFATLEFSVPTTEVKEFPLTVTVVSAEDGNSVNVAPFIATADGKISVVAEQVELEWPAADIAEDIIYGQTVADAFPEFPMAGTVKIDGVDYAGEFRLADGLAEEKPNVGEFEAKIRFVVTAEGVHKDRVFDANGYYMVTVAQAAYPETIVAASQEATYTGIAIDYLESNVDLADHPEVEIEQITYDESPVDVGDYEVTIKFNSLNTNYADPADATATLKIKKAVADDIDDFVYNLNAQDVCEISNVADLATIINLPVEATLTFNGLAEIVPVTWTAKEAEWNAKGGVNYEFIPTYECANLDLSAVDFKAVVKVAELVGTLDTADFVNVTVSKDQVLNAISFADLGIPAAATLTVASWTSAPSVDLIWDKDLEDVQAAAADVTDTEDVEVTLALSEDTFAEFFYLTVAANDTIKITITNKKPATVAPITATDGVYGEELADIEVPTWEANDGGEDEAATIKITYKGRGETEYAESEVKPTAAGTYTAVATLVSDIYAGSSSADFEIKPLDITYEVESTEKAYGEENPTFVGGAEGVIGDDDLGITFTCDAVATSPVGEYVINATAANKNYNVTVIPGTLTVTKATLAVDAPVIDGAAVVGAELVANYDEIVGGTGIEVQWYANGEAIPEATGNWYIVKIADSNKAITAKLVAVDATNYEGETAASEAIVIEKYEIAGTIGISLDTLALEVGTTVTADVTAIEGYDLFDLTFQWYVGEEAVAEATASTFEIIDGMAGVVSVVVTPSEDFAGSIKAIVGEIGKVMLPASLVLNSDAEGDIEVGTIITADVLAEEGVTEEDYDIVWLVNGEAAEVTGAEYEVTKEDYGKTISAKLVAKGDIYTGEIVSYDVYELYAKAPTNVKMEAESTGYSIIVTLTADANGAVPYFDAEIREKDAEETVEVVTIFADGEGKYEYTFEDLTPGVTYTIKATAWNTEGEGETATKDVTLYYPESEGGGTIINKPTNNNNAGGNQTSGDATTPDTSVSVESKTETATVPTKDLAGKETVSATVTTDGGNKVEVAVDIKDKAVDSLTVKAETSDKEVTGKAAEGLIGEVIEVNVDAKSGKEEVEVGATITVKADAPAYAYAVDELGNTVRLDSTYDAENGEVVVANVPDGTVLAVSTQAPVDFADVEGRWSEAEVQKAADLGIVNGRGEGYAPTELLTRSETNKLKKNLAEVLKLVLPVNEEVKIDTDPSHWAYESDLWAAQTGITTGTGTNEDGEVVISGEDNVVRQDYITLIARMIKLAIGDAEVEGEAIVFADAADIADYAADAFNLLSSVGILKGSASENGIAANPKANITREEAAALSNRAYDFVKAVKIAK